MTDLPPIPPRPAWAEPSPPPPLPPPKPTKRQAKRARYKANRDQRAANRAAAEAEAEAAARRRIAARVAALQTNRAAQHRETVERYYRHRGDRWRYDEEPERTA